MTSMKKLRAKGGKSDRVLVLEHEKSSHEGVSRSAPQGMHVSLERDRSISRVIYVRLRVSWQRTTGHAHIPSISPRYSLAFTRTMPRVEHGGLWPVRKSTGEQFARGITDSCITLSSFRPICIPRIRNSLRRAYTPLLLQISVSALTRTRILNKICWKKFIPAPWELSIANDSYSLWKDDMQS